MKVDINKYTYGEFFVLEQTIDDKSYLCDLLNAEPSGNFDVKAECLLDDSGLQVKLTAQGKCYARCDRCGETTEQNCFCSFSEELNEGDAEFDINSESYDLDGLIRECVIMSAPSTVLCKPDCKGLCLVCGTNLNYKTCTCNEKRPDVSNPFSVLQDILLTGGAKNGSTKK